MWEETPRQRRTGGVPESIVRREGQTTEPKILRISEIQSDEEPQEWKNKCRDVTAYYWVRIHWEHELRRHCSRMSPAEVDQLIALGSGMRERLIDWIPVKVTFRWGMVLPWGHPLHVENLYGSQVEEVVESRLGEACLHAYQITQTEVVRIFGSSGRVCACEGIGGEDFAWIYQTMKEGLEDPKNLLGTDPVYIGLPLAFTVSYDVDRKRHTSLVSFFAGRAPHCVAHSMEGRTSWPWHEYWYHQMRYWAIRARECPGMVIFAQDWGIAVNRWLMFKCACYDFERWVYPGEDSFIGGYQALKDMTNKAPRWSIPGTPEPQITMCAIPPCVSFCHPTRDCAEECEGS